MSLFSYSFAFLCMYHRSFWNLWGAIEGANFSAWRGHSPPQAPPLRTATARTTSTVTQYRWSVGCNYVEC